MKTLIVDDEKTSGLILGSMLENFGHRSQIVTNKSELEQCLFKEPAELIFLDYRLGKENGLVILKDLMRINPKPRVVMISAHGSIDLAVKAMDLGASGFLTKPFDEEKIANELSRAAKKTSPSSDGSGAQKIIGKSLVVQRIHTQVAKMKEVETTVLITGESGTGKELIATALHNQSKRSKEPFHAINCAAIPETLLEAELFGYKKGAFTDAKQDRKGLFEVCSKGTLFLDEVGEMPLGLQSKLLRVLQEKEVTPLGAVKAIKVQTRVVAATNRHLAHMVSQNTFRKDLYYRLSILQIDCPPLRERSDDIPELASFFLKNIAKRHGLEISQPSDEFFGKLESYSWPGNIRELQNSLERAVVLSEGGKINIDDVFSHLPSAESNPGEQLSSLSIAKDLFEKSYLEKVLNHTKGNVAEAAKIAGRLRTDMYRLFVKHDIDPKNFK